MEFEKIDESNFDLTPVEKEWQVREVRIKVPFGFIAGKWWGRKDLQPIILIHGYQDNAGTFDRLIPLLPKDLSYLAIDLPGHGFSSRIPDGIPYHYMDNLIILESIIRENNWQRIKILGHSLGGILGFIFAATFPDKVETVIGIDALKPVMFDAGMVPDLLQENVMEFLEAEERNKAEPEAYTLTEIFQKLQRNFFTNGKLNEDCAMNILQRAIRRSEKHPGKYLLKRDNRLKYNIMANSPQIPQEISVKMAERITAKKIPYLFIKVRQTNYFEDPEKYHEVFDILKRNPNFHSDFVDGSHHIHLLEPEKIAPIIQEFIDRFRSKSKL